MFREKATLAAVISAPILYVGLTPEVVGIYALLIVIDLITGVVASYIDDKKTIKSNTMIRGIITKISIFMIPFVIALVARWLGDGWWDLLKPMVWITLSILIASEAYSIIGNIYNIKTGKKVPEFDAVESIMSTILKALKLVGDNANKKVSDTPDVTSSPSIQDSPQTWV